jgi:hypothetical protein
MGSDGRLLSESYSESICFVLIVKIEVGKGEYSWSPMYACGRAFGDKTSCTSVLFGVVVCRREIVLKTS